MHDPGVLGAETPEHLGHRPHPFGRKHADQLAARHCRAGQWPEQVEDRPRAELDPGRRDMAGGTVMARRHQKAEADLPQALPHDREVRVDIDAERGQHIRRSRFRGERAIAVLGDRHAATGDHQRAGGRDIKAAGRIPAGAAGVDRTGRRVDRYGFGSHDPGRPGDLVDRLATHPERHQKGAHLRRRRVAAHDDVERRLRLALAQGAPLCDMREQRLEVGRVTGHAAVLSRLLGLVP